MPFNYEIVEKLARAHHREPPNSSEEALRRFLIFWVMQKFSIRPEAPELSTYTDDQLLYWFLRYEYLQKDPDEADRIAQGAKEDIEWAMKKARELAIKPRTPAPKTEPPVPEPKPPEPDLPDISLKFDSGQVPK